MTRPPVSVVITTHNEEAGIGRTLESLSRQSYGPVFEVIMVDDRSTDATVARAEAAGLHNLRVLHNKPEDSSPLTTRQQALDLAFRSSEGEVVLTLDGDSTVPDGWVAAMADPILLGDCAAVAGPITFAPADTAVAGWQIADAAYYFEVASLLAPLGGGGVFFGSFAFQRELYDAVGGFNAIGGALTEDLAFARALQADGHRIRFEPGPAPVEVAPCPNQGALVDRTIRVSAGPPSLLALVLTLWPVSLILCVFLALFGGFWLLLLIRYVVGASFVRFAMFRTGALAKYANWLTYEALAIALAVAVLIRVKRGAKSNWGGHTYDR